MTRIFISYRRDDTKWATGRLFDHLSARFGDDQIFMDITTIEPGEDFVAVIENAIGRCSVLVAMIGIDWIDANDEAGNRRLDNPLDFVRLEIANALQRDIRVIPVLVDNAVMPRVDTLPDDLQALCRRHGLQLRNDTFRYDVSRLIEAIEKAMNLDSRSVIAGQWRDSEDIFTSFFRQNGDRVVGFFRSKESGNIGAFQGKVEGNKGKLAWRLQNNTLSGAAIATAEDDTEHLSLDFWVGDQPQEIFSHNYRFISDELPDWLNEEEFDTFDGYLDGET